MSDDDDLPSISLTQETSMREVVMPSAREVAAARARELRTELELRRLREQHSPPHNDGMNGILAAAAAPPPRSDSSGSEGEVQLAQAVRALRVLPAPSPRAAHHPTARRMLHLLPTASQSPLQHYITVFADDVSQSALRKTTDKIVTALSCALSCEENSWSEDELLTCCGMLCAACLAASSQLVRRALHRALLLITPFQHQAIPSRLAGLAYRAAIQGGQISAARALLTLSDCARGGPPSADLFALLLVRRGLTTLLASDANDQECTKPLTAEELSELLTSGRGWRGVEVDVRHTALRLAGRALAGTRGSAGEGCAKALAALAQPPTGSDKQHPDYLKVVVAGSTLQLLFRSKE